uniref:Uncharacterized protein n=1 Tax=Rhizophora mucronata TaxID=61149 RepID=A0A2P2NKL2_RHIMU
MITTTIGSLCGVGQKLNYSHFGYWWILVVLSFVSGFPLCYLVESCVFFRFFLLFFGFDSLSFINLGTIVQLYPKKKKNDPHKEAFRIYFYLSKPHLSFCHCSAIIRATTWFLCFVVNLSWFGFRCFEFHL